MHLTFLSVVEKFLQTECEMNSPEESPATRVSALIICRLWLKEVDIEKKNTIANKIQKCNDNFIIYYLYIIKGFDRILFPFDFKTNKNVPTDKSLILIVNLSVKEFKAIDFSNVPSELYISIVPEL